MTATCTKCGNTYEITVPERWTGKHPELKGLCPVCVAERIAEEVH